MFIEVCWGRASRSSEHLQMQHNYNISYRHGGVYMGIRIKRKRFLHRQNQLNLCFSYRLKSCCLHELFTSNAGISPVSKVKPYKRTTRVFIPAWSVWYGYQTSDTVLGCVYVFKFQMGPGVRKSTPRKYICQIIGKMALTERVYKTVFQISIEVAKTMEVFLPPC